MNCDPRVVTSMSVRRIPGPLISLCQWHTPETVQARYCCCLGESSIKDSHETAVDPLSRNSIKQNLTCHGPRGTTSSCCNMYPRWAIPLHKSPTRSLTVIYFACFWASQATGTGLTRKKLMMTSVAISMMCLAQVERHLDETRRESPYPRRGRHIVPHPSITLHI